MCLPHVAKTEWTLVCLQTGENYLTVPWGRGHSILRGAAGRSYAPSPSQHLQDPFASSVKSSFCVPSLVNVSGGESSTAKDRMRPALWFGLRDLKFPTIVLKKRQFKIEQRDSAEPSGSAHLTAGASGLKPPPALLPPTLQPSHSTQHLLLVWCFLSVVRLEFRLILGVCFLTGSPDVCSKDLPDERISVWGSKCLKVRINVYTGLSDLYIDSWFCLSLSICTELVISHLFRYFFFPNIFMVYGLTFRYAETSACGVQPCDFFHFYSWKVFFIPRLLSCGFEAFSVFFF